MSDEFERIMEFFSLDPKDKESRLQDVFADSVAYFEKFKHILLHGSPEEKKEASKKIMEMREKVEAETRRISEQTGLSQEQLDQYSRNKDNFTEDQWNMIQNTKSQIEQGTGEIRDYMKEKGIEAPMPPALEFGGSSDEDKKKREEERKKREEEKRKGSTPDHWIRS